MSDGLKTDTVSVVVAHNSQRIATHVEASTSTAYCQPEVHSLMQERKARLWDDHSVRTMREARARANPFESIAGAGFQNR